jgi:hypothetical protein
MRLIYLVLTAALVAMPLTAQTRSGRTSSVGAGPQGGTCSGASTKRTDKEIPKWQPELGGDKTRQAWKKLVRLGEPGCDAVVAHLQAGAAGMESADLADAAAALILGGQPAHMAAGAALLAKDDLEVTLSILGAMEARMMHLSAEQAAAVASSPEDEVREKAIAALVGYHSIGALVFKMGIPIWEEQDWYGATVAPEQHHLDALQVILENATPAHTLRAAKYIQRLYTEGQPNQAAWAPTLAPLTALSGDDQDAANLAARGLGARDGEGIDAVVESILAGGNADTIDFLIQGLGIRLGRGLGTADTIARLEKITAGAEKKNSKAAEKLAKKWRKKV